MSKERTGPVDREHTANVMKSLHALRSQERIFTFKIWHLTSDMSYSFFDILTFDIWYLACLFFDILTFYIYHWRFSEIRIFEGLNKFYLNPRQDIATDVTLHCKDGEFRAHSVVLLTSPIAEKVKTRNSEIVDLSYGWLSLSRTRTFLVNSSDKLHTDKLCKWTWT